MSSKESKTTETSPEPRKKRPLRFLMRLFLFLVLLIIIALVVALWYIDSIAKVTVETGATYALGVTTSLEKVNIKIFDNSVEMRNLEIENTPDFTEPHLMKLGRVFVSVEGSSILTDKVRIPAIEITDLDIYLEKKGKRNNFQPVLEHLKQLSPEQTEDQQEQEPEQPSKRFVVDKLLLENITVHLDVPPLGKRSVTLPRFELTGLTNDNAAGLALPQLAGRLVPIIMADVVGSIADLPADLVKSLSSDLAGVADLLGSEITGIISEDLPQLLDSLSSEVGKGIEDAGKELEEAGKGIGKELDKLGKSLFGKKDETDKKQE